MANSNLKWQSELSESTTKVTELTKKCKKLTEDLLNTRKESVELNLEKTANTQKAQDVKVEKQKIELEIKSLTEKLERETERRQIALKDLRDCEIRLTESQTQLKLKDAKLREIEGENQRIGEELDKLKFKISENEENWRSEKSQI